MKIQLDSIAKKLEKEPEDVSISKISSKKGRLLKENISVLWESQQLKSNCTIAGYKWMTENEKCKEEREGYKNYLMQHLNDYFIANGLHLLDIEGKNILGTDDKSLPFNLKDGAELLILDDLGIRYGIHNFVGMRAIIECKRDLKKNEEQKENQAWAELLAANIKSTHVPISVLLTDLNNNWRFFVLCERNGVKGVYRVNCSEPGTGFEVLKQIIKTELDQIQILSASAPIKKIKLDEIIPPVDDGETEKFSRINSFRALELEED